MNKVSKNIWEYIQISIAIFLASVGLKAFLLPNNILDGGVTGVAILISKLTGFEISLILPFVSIPFFVIGWFTVSKRILYKSIFSVALLALIIYFENFQSITDDKLLISTFGGLFLGAGIGLAIKNGTVLDGSEILGIYIHEKIGISIGSIILTFNIVLFAITGLVFSVEIAMYSILTYIITAKTIDMFIEGFENYVGLLIISDNSSLIQDKLINEINTGLTVYNGSKGFGSRGQRENMEIIQVVANRIENKKIYRIIDQADPRAFIMEFDVNNIKGGMSKKLSPI